jgi:hypothetical protein
MSLNTTLQALADESSSATSIILLAPPQRQESLRILLENCTKGLKQLDLLVGKYPSLGPNEKTRFLEHIRFASKGKQGPRDKLAIHTASINIFLTSLTHSSLGRLELLIKNALRGGEKGGFSAFNASQDSDAWNSIGQDLALEGITSDMAVKFKHEIEAYTRHLAKGGDPFWMKSRSNPPRPQGAPPKYEAHQPMHPPPQPLSQQRPGRLFGSTPQSNSPQNQGFGFGQARITQYAPQAASPGAQTPQNQPQQQPAPTSSGGPATPQELPQSAFGQPASINNNPLSGSNTSAGTGYSFGNAQNPTTSGSDQNGGGFGSQPSTGQMTGGLFGSGTQQQPPGSGFGVQKPEQKPGGLFGSTAPATGFGVFGQPAQQQQPSTGGGLFGPKPAVGGGLFGGSITGTTGGSSGGSQPQQTQIGGGLFGGSRQSSGGLFGSKPATAGQGSSLFGGNNQNQQGGSTAGFNGGLFGGSQPPQAQTGSAFGGQQAAIPGSNTFGSQQPTTTSGGLFGNHASTSSDSPLGNTSPLGPAFGTSTGFGLAGGLFGQNSSSLFGAPQVNTKQVDELAELFDHIFDIDEDVAAMTQGATSTPYPPDLPTPLPLSESRYIPPVYSPPVYSTRPAPTVAPNIYSSPETNHPPNSSQANNLIMSNTNTTITNNLLHTVRLQLEQVLLQYRDAQRAGDSRRVDHLLQNDIQDRVQYLRNAGLILIQCDLCHAPIIDEYYHCDICADGDWDCCLGCLEHGKGCLGGHGLRRRNKDWGGEKHWMRC